MFSKEVQTAKRSTKLVNADELEEWLESRPENAEAVEEWIEDGYRLIGKQKQGKLSKNEMKTIYAEILKLRKQRNEAQNKAHQLGTSKEGQDANQLGKSLQAQIDALFKQITG